MGRYEVTKKWSYTDVIFWSLMVGAGESYIGAFALKFGFSERYAGILGVVPLALASILQLFTPRLLPLVKSRKIFVVIFSALQALSLFMVTIYAALGIGQKEVLILIMTFFWLFGLAAGPAWNVWIVTLVPKEKQFGFFSKRALIHEVSLLVALVLAGIYLHRTGGSLNSFCLLFFVAGITRLVSAFALAQHPEEEDAIEYLSPSDFRSFLQWVSKKNVIWMLIFVGLSQFGVSIAAPFFTPFVLKKLNLDYSSYMGLIAIAFIFRAISYPFIEKLVKIVGIKPILLVSVLLISAIPLFWTAMPSIFYIAISQMFGGCAWAGFEYCILLKQLSDFSQLERSRVLAWNNLVVGFCNIGGVAIGSYLLTANPVWDNYNTIFNISAVFRFLPLVFVFLIEWETSRSGITKIFLRLTSSRLQRAIMAKPILYLDKDKKEDNSNQSIN